MKVLQTIPFEEWFYAHELLPACEKLIPKLGSITSTSIGNNMRLLISKGVIQKRWDSSSRTYQYIFIMVI